MVLSAAKPALNADPELAHDKAQAGQAEELGEVAPGNIVVLRYVDGKVAPPGRLLGLRPAVRRGSPQVTREHGSCLHWTDNNSSEMVRPVLCSFMAAVTSRYSCRAELRGAIICTRVVDALLAELELVDGLTRGRSRSIFSRVPKNSASLGQTVAHIGLRPAEVRS